jgi:23S rRNA (cytidine2498-2'-O)-methyltransferase
LTDARRHTVALVAQCRAGFEPEAAIDLQRLASLARADVDIDASPGRGFVAARPREFAARRWKRALESRRPIFIRTLFVGTGPHVLLEAPLARGRPDRVAPLARAIAALRSGSVLDALIGPTDSSGASYASLRIEMPDTNEGKALSGLARALDAALTAHLRKDGVLAAFDEASDRTIGAYVHVFLVDGANAYVGASAAPWASRWPMGIPRLRMPGSAPSRSTLKLAEAVASFLGTREAELLRAGMRAVDLGAAPGGWTWQLAHRGLRVTAVDNGPLKGSVRDDPLVTHLRADGLTFLPGRPVDWMTCDIVETPARIAALVARWIGEGHARHCIFNLKLPMKKRYDEVERCIAIIDAGLARSRERHHFAMRQLYHDREEVTGCVTCVRS